MAVMKLILEVYVKDFWSTDLGKGAEGMTQDERRNR